MTENTDGATTTSPRDRVLAAAGLGKPDRVPVLTYSSHFQVRWAGYSYGEVMEDGDKFVRAQLSALEDFGYDGVTALGGPGMIAEALGADLLVQEEESPSLTRPGLSEARGEIDFDGLSRLQVSEGEHVPFALEVNESLSKNLPEEVPLIAAISSPFREACLLRGFKRLFADLIPDSSFVNELVDLMTDKVYRYAELVVRAGADILGVTDPFAGRAMVSREQYRETVFPSEKELFRRIHSDLGTPILFHTCGEWGDRFDLAIEAGADIYHVDGLGDRGLEEVASLYADRAAIMGRLPVTGILLDGNPEEVRWAGKTSIEAVGSKGGYILAGNCSLSPDTPPENLEALVAAASEYGTYPIDDGEGAVSEQEVYLG